MKLSALAWKNARQSVSIILMIALASMLICSVINLGISAQRSLVDSILEYTGDNQVRLENITEEQAAQVLARQEVALADLHLAPRGLGNPADDAEKNIGLLYSSGLGQVANFTLTAGRAPEAVNEAVIPPHLAELLGVEPIVGAEFEIFYRQQNSDRTLAEAVPMRFVVSGVLQEQRMYAAMSLYDMFISKTLAKQFDFERRLYLRFHTKYDPRSTAVRLAEDIGLADKDVSFNESYLTADLNDMAAVGFITVLLLILGAAGALVVYNAYNLSVVKKVHQYGLLTVIGAAKTQIYRCIYLEALYCAGAGLPLGLLGGTLFGYAGLFALNRVINVPMRYVVTPAAYLISAAVTLTMVWIGVTRPARRASRIAPVEAVRFSSPEEKASGRKTIENVTLNALVKINMSRSKRRLLGTVLSLAFSGILFLGFSTVAFSMADSAGNLVAQAMPGDITVTVGQYGIGNKTDPLTHELASAIGGLNGVRNVSGFMAQGFVEYADAGDGEKIATIGQKAVGVEPEVMRNILRHVYTGTVTLADLDDPHNVIAAVPDEATIAFYIREGIGYDKIIERYVVGAALGFELFDDSRYQAAGKTVSLNIIGLVRQDDIPPYVNTISLFPMFYMPQKSFAALGWDEAYERLVLRVDDERHEDIYAAVGQLCGFELSVESFKRMKDELSRQLTGIIVIVLLMLAVIALNGVLNLVGATFMGIEQRKKEFGVLMAVGLSRKSVGRLLIREGIWVSLLSAALSVVFGLGLGLVLYHMVVYAGADYLHFEFPVWPLLSLFGVLGFVPYAVTSWAARKLRRSTIVELLGRWV
ncbi:MAG: ABC transporter permease [Firmicutes bacterium]|nr:ABC transporter permease [Bacillota bacterium]